MMALRLGHPHVTRETAETECATLNRSGATGAVLHLLVDTFYRKIYPIAPERE